MFSCIGDGQFKHVKYFEVTLTTKLLITVIFVNGSGVSIFTKTIQNIQYL